MPTDVPTGVPRGVPTGSRNLSTLAVSLAIFGLACCLVLATTPRLFTGPERPGFAVFLVAGVAVVALTAVLFGFIDRLGMGFCRTVLVLAAGYNALIAGVKLGLAPAAMYAANERAGVRGFGRWIQTDYGSIWGSDFGVLLLYVLVFVVMYRRLQKAFPATLALGGGAGRTGGGVCLEWMIVVIVVVCVVFAASFLWVAPVLFVGLPTLVVPRVHLLHVRRGHRARPGPGCGSRLTGPLMRSRSRARPPAGTPRSWPASSGWVWL